ncbi:MAG: ATP-binding cassette domain-containing protein [Desulfurococcaceae archaeon]|nr:ATP-binding cassette domain-containing protein [Desulfurococcaceae archaeon]
MSNVLEIKNLKSGYGSVLIVNDASLLVGVNEVVGIVGPNGAGKTTLLKTVLGFLKPWSGDVIYLGKRINGLSTEKIVQLGIGYVPERGGVLKTLTVRENVELVTGMFREASEKLRELRKLFPLIDERASQVAGTLSGGEQKILSVVLGLLTAKKLLVMDEPSAGLAPVARKKLSNVLKNIKNNLGLSLLIAEQDPSLVTDLSDVVYVMERGSFVRSGRPDEIVRTEVLREHYLGL